MGRLTSLLLLLWVGGTTSKPLDLEKRIIGGRDCVRRSHVFVLGFDGTSYFMCGGSLISKDWVLTAAHCQQLNVTVWTNVGQNLDDPIPIQTIRREIFIDRNGPHDIMLLKLETNVTNVQPVGLPDCKKRPQLGDVVEMAGYAAIHHGPNGERIPGAVNTLKCANVRLVDCTIVLNALLRLQQQMRAIGENAMYYDYYSYQHLICGRTAGFDVSRGDSGGGVLFNNMIYGVISFTGNPTHADVEPAGFMDVCAYLPWINATTGIQPRV